ncbi:MAG TPA: SDR family oxidoreductase [Chthoniobacterales bacterium]
MNAETTLITGASSGIGFHLANEFAAHGHPTILVAPVADELRQVAIELSNAHGVPVRTIASNLEQTDSTGAIFDELHHDGTVVDILVNNAGHGFRGKFFETPLEHDLSMVRLNIEAVLRLTKLFLRPMVQRGHGRILNTASIAAFEPGPLLAVYHASKAFVLSWSEALAIELEGAGVTVTALCPGPTDTDFFQKAGMIATRAFQGKNLMAPQDVAKAAYKGLMDGELFVVPGGMNKALVAARRLLSEAAQAKLSEKFYEELPPEARKRERGDVERGAGASKQEVITP